MQLYFFGTLKVKKRGKKVLLFDLHKLAVRLLTKAELLSPFSLFLSLSSCLLCLFFSFMWCCGSWLHSIQCNLSNPPCCDVVNKLQVNWFWFVTIFFFLFFSFFCTNLFKMGTLSLAKKIF